MSVAGDDRPVRSELVPNLKPDYGLRERVGRSGRIVVPMSIRPLPLGAKRDRDFEATR